MFALKYLAYEIARNETKENLKPDDILKMDKGTFITFCDPTVKEAPPEPPKFKRFDKDGKELPVI